MKQLLTIFYAGLGGMFIMLMLVAGFPAISKVLDVVSVNLLVRLIFGALAVLLVFSAQRLRDKMLGMSMQAKLKEATPDAIAHYAAITWAGTCVLIGCALLSA